MAIPIKTCQALKDAHFSIKTCELEFLLYIESLEKIRKYAMKIVRFPTLK